MSLTLGYLSYSSFYPIFSCVSSSLHTSVLLVCIFSDALAFDPCLQFQRVPLHWQLTTQTGSPKPMDGTATSDSADHGLSAQTFLRETLPSFSLSSYPLLVFSHMLPFLPSTAQLVYFNYIFWMKNFNSACPSSVSTRNGPSCWSFLPGYITSQQHLINLKPSIFIFHLLPRAMLILLHLHLKTPKVTLFLNSQCHHPDQV